MHHLLDSVAPARCYVASVLRTQRLLVHVCYNTTILHTLLHYNRRVHFLRKLANDVLRSTGAPEALGLR